jgi:glycosyltransferase involved in cell wall biosynthesis
LSNSLVSIIVPIYKVEQYLERCLDSIIAQTYRPLEVVMVNDGSPDGCGDIMRRYEAKSPIFKSIWQKNQGVSAARNTGIAHATGEYLALIDSDDYVDPDYISSLVNLAEQKGADVAICNFYFEFSNGFKIPFPLMTLQKNMSGDEAAQNSLDLLRIPAFAWNKLYRRDLFVDHDIQFPSIYYEDVATITRILTRAKIVAITHKPYYHYCLRGTGLTGNFGLKNIGDYLKAVNIIRHFLWDENLWDAWEKPYRRLLRTVEVQLFLEITLQKNKIPFKDRSHLIRQVHHRIYGLSIPPMTDRPKQSAPLPDAKEKKQVDT